jgi:hypothetical protein
MIQTFSYLSKYYGVGAIMPTPTISSQFLPANNPDSNNPDFIDSNNIFVILLFLIVGIALVGINGRLSDNLPTDKPPTL